jgi:heat-inducible transcriptional repressor
MASIKIINERALTVLKAIVQRHIRDGQPVGSKAVVEDTAIALSSATIRNIMAELEEAGYLHSPHTSAGRVPTTQAYRLFVDTLLTVQPLGENTVKQLRQTFHAETDPSTLVERTSSLLSSITKMAGMVTVPKREHFSLRQVEFLALSANRVLAIFVFNNREVQNHIIATERAYSPSELQQASNYLTQNFAGKDLAEIRQDILNTIRHDREKMQSIMSSAMDIVEKAFVKDEKKDYVLAGESNLLMMAEQAGIDRIRSLFEVLTQKRDILHLLDGCLESDGVKIFIGKESGYAVLDDCSMVTAPYTSQGKTVGVLGVIGPTRMDYDYVISAVDVTAKLLSAALTEAE